MLASRPLPAIGAERARILYDRFGRPLNLTTNEFGALSVAEDETIFDSKQIFKQAPAILFDTLGTGDGSVTYQQQRSATQLQVTGSGSAIRRTRRPFNYQPAKRLKADLSYVPSELSGNATLRLGMFNDTNGVFLRQRSGGDLAVVIRSDVTGSVVEDEILRRDWLDPLDGQRSTYQLTNDRAQIFWISYAWLGVGSVACGFRWGDHYVPIAIWEHAQELSQVYMRTPCLHVGWELSATYGSGSVDAICCSVNSEGGHTPLAVPRGDFADGITCPAGAITEIISGRLLSGSSATVYPTGFEVELAGNAYGHILLCYNPTWSAGVASWRAPQGEDTTSHVQLTHTARTVGSLPDVGHILASKRATARSAAALQAGGLVALGCAIDGTPDELSVLFHNTSVSTGTISTDIGWVELL